MFWRTYSGVVGWLIAVGAVVGAVLLLLVFGWLVPSDRGEESAVAVMPFIGAFLGALTAAAAGVVYVPCLTLWNRRSGRTVASRARVGGLSAGAGALALWVVVGFAVRSPYGLPVWTAIGGASAVVALLVAGPLTARAARRSAPPN